MPSSVMEFFKRLLPALLLVFLLVASGMGPEMRAEAARPARIPGIIKASCEMLSKQFRGLCIVDINCNRVCLDEHFVGGQCGLVLRCICHKPC